MIYELVHSFKYRNHKRGSWIISIKSLRGTLNSCVYAKDALHNKGQQIEIHSKHQLNNSGRNLKRKKKIFVLVRLTLGYYLQE